jgi:hypothetical protein
LEVLGDVVTVRGMVRHYRPQLHFCDRRKVEIGLKSSTFRALDCDGRDVGMNLRSHSLDKLRQIITTGALLVLKVGPA